MAPDQNEPDFHFELHHWNEGRVAVGVDEVGRGCLAGPVVTAAVILPHEMLHTQKPRSHALRSLERALKDLSGNLENAAWWWCLDDSKKLRPPEREVLARLIWKYSRVHVSWCDSVEIDRWNILHASLIAMRRALFPFAGIAQTVLVDGHIDPYRTQFRAPEGEAYRLGFTHVEPIVQGDAKSLSIAAASIVAKVFRDQWMSELDSEFPGYSFAQHKGYSTPMHYEALEKLGPCSIHRQSFAPIGGGPNVAKSSSYEELQNEFVFD